MKIKKHKFCVKCGIEEGKALFNKGSNVCVPCLDPNYIKNKKEQREYQIINKARYTRNKMKYQIENNRDSRVIHWDQHGITQIYDHCKAVTDKTGIKHDVDHIIPLKHHLVCGLHVANNLQVIPHLSNIKKSNTFIKPEQYFF